MTTAEKEARIEILQTRLTAVQGAINRALGIGASWSVGNGKGSRQFQNYSLAELQTMESNILAEIKQLEGGSGAMVGAGW